MLCHTSLLSHLFSHFRPVFCSFFFTDTTDNTIDHKFQVFVFVHTPGVVGGELVSADPRRFAVGSSSGESSIERFFGCIRNVKYI